MQPSGPMGVKVTVEWAGFRATMAAASSSLYSGSKLLLGFTCKGKKMPLKFRWTIAFLVFTLSRCFADDDHEMEEFLKREHSLSKPYQGTCGTGGGRALRGEDRYFQNNVLTHELVHALAAFLRLNHSISYASRLVVLS